MRSDSIVHSMISSTEEEFSMNDRNVDKNNKDESNENKKSLDISKRRQQQIRCYQLPEVRILIPIQTFHYFYSIDIHC